MLEEFIRDHGDVIVARAQDRVRRRACPAPSDVELKHGIPVFLEQLRGALAIASRGKGGDHAAIERSAQRHGHDLLRTGLTIGQVVHDYGDVCQVITDLAIDEAAPIPVEEFQTLNLCLDDAIAAAVTEYSRQRERTISDAGTERLGMLAHELRNLLNTAMLAFDSIRRGQVTATGSTSVVLDRALRGLRNLVDRSMADVRLDAGVDAAEPVSVAELIEEVEIGGILQARSRDIRLSVSSDEPAAIILGDRQILAAALANLLQNALKFTPKHGHVALNVHATPDAVLFDVEDACGGLPPGKAEGLFRPFEQRGTDRSGVGLGLAICMKAAKASHGDLRVRDLPGHGCVFTLEIPRHPAPAPL